MVEDVATDGLIGLYRERYSATVRLAFVMTGHSGVAEELAQEAFVRTWQAWPRLKHEGAPAAYLRTTVLNLARSSLRRRAIELRHRRRHQEQAAVDPDAALRIDLIRTLQKLPARQRQCIALRYLEDLSEVETAAVLGIEVGTVKSQTHKALRRLERLMGGVTDG